MNAFDFIENHNVAAAELVEANDIEVTADDSLISSVAKLIYEGDFEGRETAECEIHQLDKFLFAGVKQVVVNPRYEPLDPDVIPAGERAMFNLREALNNIGDVECVLSPEVVQAFIQLSAALTETIQTVGNYAQHFEEVHPIDKQRFEAAFTLTT